MTTTEKKRGPKPRPEIDFIVKWLENRAASGIGWNKADLRREFLPFMQSLPIARMQDAFLTQLANTAIKKSKEMTTDDGLPLWIVTDEHAGAREHIDVLSGSELGIMQIEAYGRTRIDFGNSERRIGRKLIEYAALARRRLMLDSSLAV